MDYKTIRVSYDNWLELMGLKAELGLKDFDEVIEFLIKEYAESLLTEMQKTLNDKLPDGKLIPYPGGDYFIADEIVELLEKSHAITLVEVFGGSGYISTVAKNSFKVVIYNDIDDLLVSFFKCLKERPRELLKALSYLPFSRQIKIEFKKQAENLDDELSKAVTAFYIHNTTMFGCFNRKEGFAVSKTHNRAGAYANKLKKLYEFAGLWRNIVIENRDFRKIFELYDWEKTVFYCDPPFLSTNIKRDDYYRFTFTEQDFKDLLACLSKIKGKFVLKIHHDLLKYGFISEWVGNYRVKEVEHSLMLKKPVDEDKREKTKTFLVYNFD